MKLAIALVVVLLLASPASAQLAPYWVHDAGCVKQLAYEWSTASVEARLPLQLFLTIDQLRELYTYQFDDEGDVLWSRLAWFDPAHSYDEEIETYTPPVKVLDYPLTTGKTWATSSLWHHWGSMPRGIVVTGTVVGPTQVETGLGVLDVIEMTLEFDYTLNHLDYTRTYYLHDQLGDVSNLASLECDVVATEPVAWGRVKSLYR